MAYSDQIRCEEITEIFRRYNNSIFGWAGHTKEGKTFSNVSGWSLPPSSSLVGKNILSSSLVGFSIFLVHSRWSFPCWFVTSLSSLVNPNPPFWLPNVLIQWGSRSERKSPCRAMMDVEMNEKRLLRDVSSCSSNHYSGRPFSWVHFVSQ